MKVQTTLSTQARPVTPQPARKPKPEVEDQIHLGGFGDFMPHNGRLPIAVGAAVGAVALGLGTSGLTGGIAHAAGMIQGAVGIGACGTALGGATGFYLGWGRGDNPDSKPLGAFAGLLAGGLIGTAIGIPTGAVLGSELGVGAGNALGYLAGTVIGGATAFYLNRQKSS